MAFVDYQLIPLIYREGESAHRRWQEIAYAAKTSRVALGCLGDSRSAQNGAGGAWLCSMNSGFFKRYLSIPETPYVWSASSGDLNALWLLRTGDLPDPDLVGHITTAPGTVSTTFNLPSQSVRGVRAIPGGINSRGEGMYFKLEPDHYSAQRGIPTHWGTFVDTSLPLYADVWCWTTGAVGELDWQFRPTNAAFNVDTGGTITAQGTLDMDLDGAANVLKTAAIGPLAYGGLAYPQLRLVGTHATNYTQVAMMRWRFDGGTGIVLHNLSEGGYGFGTGSPHFIGTYDACDQMIQALGLSAVIFRVDVNDQANGVSAVNFKTAFSANVDWFRARTGIADLLVIYDYNHEKYTDTAPHDAEMDQYLGAVCELADADPNILPINTRRLLHRLGVHETSQAFTGRIDRGAWATPVAYAVNDYVEAGINAGGTGGTTNDMRKFFLCTVAHTSSASDYPATNDSSSMRFWRPIHRLFDQESEVVHLGSWGSYMVADAFQSILFGPQSPVSGGLRGRGR